MFKSGFGGITCNYWLGNEMLHQLTKNGQYNVRFDVQALVNGTWYWAEYSTFVVNSEATRYQLTVSGYSGNAGDAMAPHNNMMFTTLDSDNDMKDINCAIERGGGFWWKHCGAGHLNACSEVDYKTFSWKKLPLATDTRLQTSRAWLMCP